MKTRTLPKLRCRLAGGTIEQFKNGYALVKQLKNPFQVSYSNLKNEICIPVYQYHIVKLTMNGRGWCNGRYDLPDTEDTQNKFLKLASY